MSARRHCTSDFQAFRTGHFASVNPAFIGWPLRSWQDVIKLGTRRPWMIVKVVPASAFNFGSHFWSSEYSTPNIRSTSHACTRQARAYGRKISTCRTRSRYAATTCAKSDPSRKANSEALLEKENTTTELKGAETLVSCFLRHSRGRLDHPHDDLGFPLVADKCRSSSTGRTAITCNLPRLTVCHHPSPGQRRQVIPSQVSKFGSITPSGHSTHLFVLKCGFCVRRGLDGRDGGSCRGSDDAWRAALLRNGRPSCRPRRYCA